MANNDGSVAPKERVNIVYKSKTGDKSEDVELPLKMLMIGDYTGRACDDVVEDREPININKDNFDDVMKSYNLSMTFNVANKLDENDEATELPINISFNSMKDFGPENIVKQVPELNKLLELRQALLALKGPLGNVPAFRKKIQQVLSEDDSRAQLMKELGVENK